MKVSVTIHSVKGLPGRTDLLNKTDSYIEVHYGTFHKFHTKTAKDAGSSADFEETWTFDSNDRHSEITIKAKDAQHMSHDEVLAEGCFKFENRSGFYFNGDVGLVNMKHCHEPFVTITVRVD